MLTRKRSKLFWTLPSPHFNTRLRELLARFLRVTSSDMQGEMLLAYKKRKSRKSFSCSSSQRLFFGGDTRLRSQASWKTVNAIFWHRTEYCFKKIAWKTQGSTKKPMNISNFFNFLNIFLISRKLLNIPKNTQNICVKVFYIWLLRNSRAMISLIIHEMFSHARDCSERVTWLNIPQLKLGKSQWYSLILKLRVLNFGETKTLDNKSLIRHFSV